MCGRQSEVEGRAMAAVRSEGQRFVEGGVIGTKRAVGTEEVNSWACGFLLPHDGNMVQG
jgi:hypothetical protein